METSFPLIHELTVFLAPLYVRWFVSGGWAIDLHLDRKTRERGDLDISVPYQDRLEVLEFFISSGWQIEGKLLGGFKTIQEVADYTDDIRYFWSFPKGSDFIGTDTDDEGNRRLAYNRNFQTQLDYIEVFFDKIEAGQFIYRRNTQITRRIEQAFLPKNDIQYLAPEVVLLYKSAHISEKNQHDFDAALDALNPSQKAWLIQALSQAYDGAHDWLKQLE